MKLEEILKLSKKDKQNITIRSIGRPSSDEGYEFQFIKNGEVLYEEYPGDLVVELLKLLEFSVY
jgi:hypothetical protein